MFALQTDDGLAWPGLFEDLRSSTLVLALLCLASSLLTPHDLSLLPTTELATTTSTPPRIFSCSQVPLHVKTTPDA